MTTINEMVDKYIAETGQAEITHQDNWYGVLFKDEGEFIPFSDLGYNSDFGFYRISQFPDVENQAKHLEQTNFSTATFWEHGQPDYQMWAIITDDFTDGFIIGEWESVLKVYETVKRLVETRKADEEVHRLDERLGIKWLSVSEAAVTWSVPIDTVRYAAREGHIPHAKKEGNEWRFPQRTFLYWLSKVYQPKEK